MDLVKKDQPEPPRWFYNIFWAAMIAVILGLSLGFLFWFFNWVGII